MSLRKKMAHGVFWTFLEKGGQQIIFIIVFTVLTHLIGPEEFGLYSLCYVVVSFSMMVIYGTIDSIIVNKTEDDESLSTLFWTIFSLGVTLSIITFAISGPFAVLMKDHRLKGLLRMLCVLPTLMSITAIPSGLVQSRMDFKVFTIRSLVSSSLSGIFGIILALNGAGAASMIGQQIAQQTIDNCIIWPSVNWKPKLIFIPHRVPSLILPGLKMMGSTMLNFFEMNSARILIGIYLGPISVGYYSFVNRLWIVLREVLALPITTVLFPALVHTQKDEVETNKLVKQIAFISGLIVFPVVAGVMATAPHFIPLFFGDKWLPAIAIMQVFLAGAVMGPFMFILRDVLRARRETEIYFMLQLTLLAANVAIMLITAKSGLMNLCWGLLTVAYIGLPISIYIVSKKTKLALPQAFIPLGRSLLASIVMYGAVSGLEYAGLIPANEILHLLFLVIVGGVTYVVMSVLLQYNEIKNGIVGLKRLIALRKQDEVPVLEA
jgi:O-antigen/teichoic acid export membrane protein